MPSRNDLGNAPFPSSYPDSENDYLTDGWFLQPDARDTENPLERSNIGLEGHLIAWIPPPLSGIFSITFQHKHTLTARGNPNDDLSG
jgi:hypothetical protein